MKLSPEGKQLVERVLTARAWTLEKLEKESGYNISTVKKFSSGKDVGRITFVELCEILEIDWEIASGQTIAPAETLKEPFDSSNNSFSFQSQVPQQGIFNNVRVGGDLHVGNIEQLSNDSARESQNLEPSGIHYDLSQPNDALFQQVREHCKQKIINQHSRMRLLSGEEIGVDLLYVDVWLLNRPPHTFQVFLPKLLETFDLRNDRVGLGDRIRRDQGFEVAKSNTKLLILGKPGSGKTIFLKHLAVDWCKGEFQPDLIAVFIELRRIRDKKWNLIEAIDWELGLENWNQFEDIKKQIKTLKQERQIKELRQTLDTLPLQHCLKNGKLLVLMDGLDEIPTSKLRNDVQKQIRQLAEEYPKNRLILTCRTQTMDSIPVGFTSVEVADFNKEQVQQFVQNWFTASGQSNAAAVQKCATFNRAANRNPDLKELTTTPVLLSLMCWVLQDSGEIPSQKDELYRKGVNLLLSQWNDAKKIDGWEVGNEIYRRLKVDQKTGLLMEIAARKFENPQNFVLFQQKEIATQVTQLLLLTDLIEGIAVLKAIEAQHGLLIERADELWSFSHLTFQEYFTLQWLTQLPSEQLAAKIADWQWQGVVKRIVKSQQPADRLLRLIKQAINQSIASEPKLQEFLIWLLRKSESIQTNQKSAAIRAFYLNSALTHIHSHVLDGARTRAHAHVRTHAMTTQIDCSSIFDFASTSTTKIKRINLLNRAINSTTKVNHNIISDLDLDRSLVQTLDFSLALAQDRAQFLAIDRSTALKFIHAFNCALDFARVSDLRLAEQLEQLRLVLPTTKNSNNFQQWRLAQGEQWIEHVRQAMIEYRNIGHNWQLTDTQIQQLQRYYDANKFLVELMQIEGAVSDDVRAEIEDSLLLPWEELQRRQS